MQSAEFTGLIRRSSTLSTLAPTHPATLFRRGAVFALLVALRLSPSHFTASSSSHGDQSPPLSLPTKIT
eukprot:scaffold20280_cov110-Skeletonema_marinoi.AAC.2